MGSNAVPRLQLHYTLLPQAGKAVSAQIRNPLIELLQAVASHGSISAAARALDLSYRHVWGELKRWELELGYPLLLWEKGRSARLSPHGAQLLRAESEAQARLAPHLAAVRRELERAYASAGAPAASASPSSA